MSEAICLEGMLVDVVAGRLFPGQITVEQGRIARVEATPGVSYPTWIAPGLIDAHVHVESSLLSPAEFGRAAMVQGTVASVSDPHEIANVLGIRGVMWMLKEAHHTPFTICFGAPSCVPATPFETAGASFGPEEVDQLLAKEEIGYLAEVMNFPGVLCGDPRMLQIIERAKAHGKRIDGHAPALRGQALKQYVGAGIETDHESMTLEEAREKCQLGMKIAIREGSAARNFEALWPLLKEFPESCFFCSDDKHPDGLVVSHINALVARAIAYGIAPVVAFRAATLNPAQHYGLKLGLLQVGDAADLAEFDSLESMRCLRCWKDGQQVAEQGTSRLLSRRAPAINVFEARETAPEDFRLPKGTGPRQVIVALDGQIVTEVETVYADGPDPERDLALLAVVNRYAPAPPAVALVRGFGLQDGALASSVAHDSHNVVVVGTNPRDLSRAANLVIAAGGGLSVVAGSGGRILPLPIAGLMSDGNYLEVADAFTALTQAAQGLGCPLASPYMTLSFMALLVIPQLKLSDKGLFDVERFAFLEPFNSK